MRGPQVMAGYYRNPDATARAVREGWLHTGDLGYVDDEGDLFLVQRRSDLIVTGGENVYPAEVEAVLRAHPAVAEACVVGVSDAEWGQRVAAAVQLAPGEAVEAMALLAFCRERLAGYKVPRQMRFVAELPQTASGKIERRRVGEMMG
jgi:o-succinylbenzoate---CoA ligase